MADRKIMDNMPRLPPVSILISPPEAKRYDSFGQSQTSSQRSSFISDCVLPPIHASKNQSTPDLDGLPSPPISPWAAGKAKVDPRLGNAHLVDEAINDNIVRDPELFSRVDPHAALGADIPLFPPVQVDPTTDALITKHMAMHMTQFNQSMNKPTRDEYLLALSCVPMVSKGYNQNPGAWLRREREFLDERRPNHVTKRPVTKSLARIAPAPTVALKRQKLTNRIAKPARGPRTPKQTPIAKIQHSFDGDDVASPRQRTIGVNREDTDYNSLPDFAPPTSTLPKSNAKVLKADWKGQPLDLSSDPDRHELHEAEVILASTLRLCCATYLCSKRRIFKARLDYLRINKRFGKTDSQMACNIDVNKASKLWTAYDKVGWFDPQHFRQYI
ncbi:MAG: hypothetical protein M1827_002137 [Pycnora praestabilis]|nr:MAG: hypothetical protein M1827_002137 [Pycnora praestabilis]